jgi:hypothetical protein
MTAMRPAFCFMTTPLLDSSTAQPLCAADRNFSGCEAAGHNTYGYAHFDVGVRGTYSFRGSQRVGAPSDEKLLSFTLPFAEIASA